MPKLPDMSAAAVRRRQALRSIAQTPAKPAKAEKSDLKAGASVIVTAAKQPDGSLSASRVTVAKGGAQPF